MARLKGLTHKELADKAELSQSTISSITNGGNGENVANPSLETMVKIASALDTDLTSLLKHHDLDIEALKNLGLDDTFYINNPKTESTQDFEIFTRSFCLYIINDIIHFCRSDSCSNRSSDSSGFYFWRHQ